MKGFSVFVVTVACAIVCGVSNAQESPPPAEEHTSISPDKKWEYLGGEDEAKIVVTDTKQVVLQLSNQGTGDVVWAPDSKRFGFNYSPMHAHHMTFQSRFVYATCYGRESGKLEAGFLFMLLNEFLKEHRKVEALQASLAQQQKDLQATTAQQQREFESKITHQQKQIEALTAGLQKVSAQIEAS